MSISSTNGSPCTDTKNGERRAVLLAGKALGLLQELIGKKLRVDSNLVFSGSFALNRGPASIRTAWITALKKAEVDNFKYHDLRYSAASYLAMSGAFLDIAAILGHKTLSMVKAVQLPVRNACGECGGEYEREDIRVTFPRMRAGKGTR